MIINTTSGKQLDVSIKWFADAWSTPRKLKWVDPDGVYGFRFCGVDFDTMVYRTVSPKGHSTQKCTLLKEFVQEWLLDDK